MLSQSTKPPMLLFGPSQKAGKCLVGRTASFTVNLSGQVALPLSSKFSGFRSRCTFFVLHHTRTAGLHCGNATSPDKYITRTTFFSCKYARALTTSDATIRAHCSVYLSSESPYGRQTHNKSEQHRSLLAVKPLEPLGSSKRLHYLGKE